MWAWMGLKGAFKRLLWGQDLRVCVGGRGGRGGLRKRVGGGPGGFRGGSRGALLLAPWLFLPLLSSAGMIR